MRYGKEGIWETEFCELRGRGVDIRCKQSRAPSVSVKVRKQGAILTAIRMHLHFEMDGEGHKYRYATHHNDNYDAKEDIILNASMVFTSV